VEACNISDLNPADDVSHGVRIEELLSNIRWFIGPEFLQKDASQWPISSVMTTDITDLELKKEAKVCVMCSQGSADTATVGQILILVHAEEMCGMVTTS